MGCSGGKVTHRHEAVELGRLDHLAEAELVLGDGGPARLARGPPGLGVLRLPRLRRRRHSAGPLLLSASLSTFPLTRAQQGRGRRLQRLSSVGAEVGGSEVSMRKPAFSRVL